MARVVLVTGQPLDVAARAPVPVSLAGGGSRAYAWDGRDDWLGGIMGPPRFTASLAFDQTGWTGGVVPTTGAIAWAPADAAVLSRIASLYWVDQRVTIRVGDDAAGDPGFVTTLVGKVAKQEVSGGQMLLTVADLSGDLAKPIIPAAARFAGSGGIEGDASVAGRAKRRSWGRVFDIEGRVLIAADNIYEFGDPGRPLHSIPTLRDKGRPAPADDVTVVAWAGSVDATLAVLRASAPARGGGVVAPSIACAKWWTQPSGPLAADLHGEGGDAYAETPAGIAALIVAGASDLAVAEVEAAIALRPGVAGIHADDVNETAASLLDRLLPGASLAWIVDPAGVVRFRPWAWPAGRPARWSGSAAVGSGWADAGAAPAVWSGGASAAARLRSAQVSRKEVLRPITSRRLGYQRNYRIHTDGEISAALLADDVQYADGRSVAELQPAEGHADVTSSNQHTMSAPAPIGVAADYLGNVVAGQLPLQRSFRRLLGGADVSPDATWSITVPAGVDATIDDLAGDLERGTVTVTGLSVASATVTVRSSYRGLDLYGELVVSRVDATTADSSGSVGGGGAGGDTGGGGSTGAPGAAATVTANGSPGTSADFAAITPEMSVTIGSSGKATLSFQLSYTASRGTEDDDPTIMLARFARYDGGAWLPVGDTAAGSAARNYFRIDPPKGVVNDAGAVSFSITAMGLVAGVTRLRVEAARDSGVGVASVTGSAGAQPL